jgi:hypothetical protein
MRGSTSLQLLLLSAALISGAAACGGGASESPSGSTQVIGPVILEPTQASAEVTVGRTVVFNVEDPGAWTMAADPADLVELTPGGELDGATFSPGAAALAAGNVTITLTNSTSGEVLTFAITIK